MNNIVLQWHLEVWVTQVNISSTKADVLEAENMDKHQHLSYFYISQIRAKQVGQQIKKEAFCGMFPVCSNQDQPKVGNQGRKSSEPVTGS